MKQIKTIFTTVCLFLLLSVPMTAWAAPEPEPVTWTETMEGKPADVEAGEETENAVYERGAETKQEAEADQEAKPKQETEPEKEKAKSQAAQRDSGTLRIQNAAAGTGERLSGAVFAVYENNGAKKGELTLKDGAASLSLPAGDYYLKQLKAPSGYGTEPARIVFTVWGGETTLAEVTSEIDLKNVNPQDIIPKTGQIPPVRAYVFSVFCLAAAFLCGFELRRMDGRNQRKGGAHLWQS